MLIQGAIDFNYILEKIKSAEFCRDPFPYILIEDFLSESHFSEVTSARQILRPVKRNSREMIDDLLGQGFAPQSFPGCITSVEKYLRFVDSTDGSHDEALIQDINRGLLEGYGMALRLQSFQSAILDELVEFINSDAFRNTLTEKFELENRFYVEGAIQKYLNCYEISPHPDIRKKALTYMLNINTTQESEVTAIHTYLLRFKPERRYVYEFWRQNPDIDTCWVPWDWCQVVKETNLNNSITIFKPENKSLHAVKLNYDHLRFQRTQVYGNFWYDQEPCEYAPSYCDIDLLSACKDPVRRRMGVGSSGGTLKNPIRNAIRYFDARLVR